MISFRKVLRAVDNFETEDKWVREAVGRMTIEWI